jgi:hypothetical protein
MIKNFDEIRKQLGELAPVINSFKSEAVQLRVVELIFRAAATDDGESQTDTSPTPPAARRPNSRRSAKKPSVGNGNTQPRAKGTGRLGGHAMLNQLVASGFFKKAKTIGEIVAHCETDLAVKYKQSDFSGPLIRLVRDNKLKRAKNKDQQYEYSQQ